MEQAAARVGPTEAGLRPGLGLFDSVTLVAGSMIGSGIFIVAADIVRQVGSPAALLATWIVAGLMTIAGALAYGELAAMMPQAGGQYVYLREAYGGLWAFLFGWTLLLVIQSGTIAAVAIAFARFLGVLWPALGSRVWLGAGSFGFSGERVGAILVIALLTIANLRGLNLGRLVQNSFTIAKTLALVMIVLVGCVLFPNPAALRANFGSAHAFFSRDVPTDFLAVFGAAMVGALFSADAWASVTYTASEIRNPRRDLPRALAFGSGAVILLYVLTNLAYLFQLPAAGVAHGSDVFARGIAHAASDRVASAAMEVVWGAPGASLTAILVMISAFGCANGLILTGARVVYAMAEDGVFFAAARRLNVANVPAFALIVQGVWAAVLTVSGTYSDLLDYVIFAALFFYVLTVGAVFRLRRTRPDVPRPYRTWGYPIVPAAYVIAAAGMMIDLLVMKPRFTWPGVIIVLSGVPIYFVTRRRTSVGSARSRG
jgi:basic amino acid/polyamine antiporter, APA family